MLKVSLTLKLKPLKPDEFNQNPQYKGENVKECLIWPLAVSKVDWLCLVLAMPACSSLASCRFGSHGV